MKKSVVRWFVLVLFLGSSGFNLSCDLGSSIENAAHEVITKAVQALQEAERQGQADVANIQRILQDALDQLGPDADQLIRGELNSLIQRTVASVGVEARCGVNFIANQTVLGLERLLDVLSGNAPREVTSPPVICNLDPIAIDLGLHPTTLAIYGYDIRPDNLSAFLQESTGKIEITQYLSVSSGYEMTLNLGTKGVPISKNSQKILFTWKGGDLSSVPVIQQKTPICKTRALTVVPNPATVTPNQVLVGGGSTPTKFSTFSVSTQTSLQLVPMERYLYAVMSLSAYGIGLAFPPKGQMILGTTISQVYTADPGWNIIDFGYQTDLVKISYTNARASGTDSVENKEFVALVNIFQDRDANGIGAWSATYKFNPLTLTLQEDDSDGHCIPMKEKKKGFLVVAGYPANLSGKGNTGEAFFGVVSSTDIPLQFGNKDKVADEQAGAFAQAFPLEQNQTIQLKAPIVSAKTLSIQPQIWKGCSAIGGTPPTSCTFNATLGKPNLVEIGFAN